MDDLEVIRLAAIENIAKERVARASVEVKENFGKGGEGAARGLPDPIYRDFLSPGGSLPAMRQTLLAGSSPASVGDCSDRPGAPTRPQSRCRP